MNETEKLRARGEVLYQEGDIEAALEVYRRLLDRSPQDAELFSDAAAVCFAAGLLEESRRCCLRALEIDADCREARQNLERLCVAAGASVEATLAQARADSHRSSGGKLEEVFEDGRYAEAYALARQWTETEPENPEAWNDAAVAARVLGKTAEAIGYIQQAVELAPDDPTIGENLEKIQTQTGPALRQNNKRSFAASRPRRPSTKTRVLLLERENPAAFLRKLVGALQAEQSLDVRYMTVGPNTVSLPLEWADVVWLEWADAVTAALTRKAKALRNTTTVCRLHRFEVFTEVPRTINWDVVDCLIFVADHMRRTFNRRFPEIEVRKEVVPNGVDVASFTIPSGKEEVVDIAFLAHLNHRKNLPLLLQTAAGLREAGADSVIHVGGDWQGVELEEYFEHLRHAMGLQEVLLHDGYIEDVPGWLADKRFLLSTSLSEGHPYNVLEGMAAGLKPVVHNFPGATDLLSEKWVFNTVQEAVRSLTTDPGEPNEYREWVSQHYSRQAQVKAICKLLTELRLSRRGEVQPPEAPREHPPPEPDESLRRTYDAEWYLARTMYRPTYHAFARAVEKVFEPDSLLDLGCGAGYLVEFFADRIPTLGIDGSPAAFEVMSPKAARNSLLADLTEPPPPEMRGYPFVVSVEVAEHIPEEEIENFLAWFAHAEQVLLTAAPPGQGGRHHVNERLPAYWKRRFQEMGFEFCSDKTRQWRAMARAFTRGCQWVVQNAMAFRRNQTRSSTA